MTKREPLMDEEYFIKEVQYDLDVIKKKEDDFKKNPEQYVNPGSFNYSMFLKKFHLLFYRYSAGEDIIKIKNEFHWFVGDLEKFHTDDRREKITFSYKGSYVKAVWAVSLAIMLKVEDELFVRLIKCFENEGEDLLYEKLIATRVSGRKPGKKLLFPKIYQHLYDAIFATPIEKPKLIKDFLSKWYKNMRDEGWHDTHKQSDAGFFGYWCWEAAGVVYAFNIDDTSFRDMPFYPKDMIDFAREEKMIS